MTGSALEGLTLRQITCAANKMGLTYGEMVTRDMKGELDRERVLFHVGKREERAEERERKKRCGGCRYYKTAGGVKLC